MAWSSQLAQVHSSIIFLSYYIFEIPVFSFLILLSGDYETLTRRLPKRSASDQVRPRSQSTEKDDHKKLRKARGSHVVIGDDNVDFPSSPVPSPAGSPAKHAVSSP